MVEDTTEVEILGRGRDDEIALTFESNWTSGRQCVKQEDPQLWVEDCCFTVTTVFFWISGD